MARAPQGRPPGDLEKITDAWRDRVREALKERGKKEQWLADQLAMRLKRPRMKRWTVNKLLSVQKQSSLVPHISAILEIDTPHVPDAELQPDVRRLIDLVVRQPPARVRALLSLLEDTPTDE